MLLHLPVELQSMVFQALNPSEKKAFRMVARNLFFTHRFRLPRTRIKLSSQEASELCEDILEFSRHFQVILTACGYAQLHTIQIEFDYMAWSEEFWERLCVALSNSGVQELNILKFQLQLESWHRLADILSMMGGSCQTLRLKDSVSEPSFLQPSSYFNIATPGLRELWVR